MTGTVLFIDEEPERLGRARRLLEKTGCRVIVAEGHEAGVAAFSAETPDVTFVDYRLGSEPAAFVCRKLKRSAHGKRSSVIMLTARRGKGKRRTRGPDPELCDDWLARTVPDKALMSMVKKHVRRRTKPPRGGAKSRRPRQDSNPAAARAVESRHGPRKGSEGESDRRPRGIAGDLDTLDLSEIAQVIALGAKTARVRLSNDGRDGEVWFEGGTPTHATLEDRVGEQAFYEMVVWRSGEFRVEQGIRCADRSLDKDAMFLVLEGARLQDESARARNLEATVSPASSCPSNGGSVAPDARGRARRDRPRAYGTAMIVAMLLSAVAVWWTVVGI